MLENYLNNKNVNQANKYLKKAVEVGINFKLRNKVYHLMKCINWQMNLCHLLGQIWIVS